MKVIICLVVAVVALGRCEEKYTTKYDDVDLDEIIASERLLNGYLRCLLDEGPCSPDGKALKSNLPDAIQNECRKCTERQKAGSDKVMGFIIEHRPQDWKRLELKYNSDGSYKKRYLKEKAAAEGKGAGDDAQAEDGEGRADAREGKEKEEYTKEPALD